MSFLGRWYQLRRWQAHRALFTSRQHRGEELLRFRAEMQRQRLERLQMQLEGWQHHFDRRIQALGAPERGEPPGPPADRIALPGSERTGHPNALDRGDPDPNERIRVAVLLRRPSSELADLVHRLRHTAPKERRHLTRQEFASRFAADREDIRRVEEFARQWGLDVVQTKAPERLVMLEGSIRDLSEAFHVRLRIYEDAATGDRFRGREGPIHIPHRLAHVVVGVFGLDNSRLVEPHLRTLDEEQPFGQARPSQARASSFTPLQVAQLYNFPQGVTGRGQCIGILEFGGGMRSQDISAYFAQLGLPAPQVTAVSVAGGHNRPTGNINGPDGEVMLDVEVAGAVAPEAHIVVYFAPNTSLGFLAAIQAAVHDTQNQPSVISISWGGPEPTWTKMLMDAMDHAFQAAAALGVTVFAAAGDNGSNDGMNTVSRHNQRAFVDFPASSPHATGCGGTHITVAGTTITQEVTWNDGAQHGSTGGGVSSHFGLPAYQSNIGVPQSVNPPGHVGRGVPDVAGNASPLSGFLVRVDGRQLVIGGTSAVAPLWAGLTALLNEALGHPIGDLNSFIYQMGGSGAFDDITSGDNDLTHAGGYSAGPGWDACTGLGRPNGARLLQALQA